MANNTKTNRVTETPQPFQRGHRQFTHDLYKLEPAKMLKNRHYNQHEPNLIEIEHCHFFHSTDRKGSPQNKTSAVGGHYHEITVDWNRTSQDGHGPHVEVGPPIKIGSKRLPSGRRVKQPMPVRWHDERNDQQTVDNHRHRVTYLGRENLVIKAPNQVTPEFLHSMQATQEPSKNIPGLEIKE